MGVSEQTKTTGQVSGHGTEQVRAPDTVVMHRHIQGQACVQSTWPHTVFTPDGHRG